MVVNRQIKFTVQSFSLLLAIYAAIQTNYFFFETNNDLMYTLKLSGSYYGFDQQYLGF